MNFLAHTYLSCSNEDLLIGNFLADFLKNKEIDALPSRFHKGIDLHRKIDSFTDAHPTVLELNKRFHSVHHKYAPVVTDVLFDFVLAQEWKRYSGEKINDFISQTYEVLLKHEQFFPERRKTGMLAMINGDFLRNYTHREGLAFTFTKMDQRTKFSAYFIKALDHLDENLPYLTSAFNQFFPDLIAEVDTFCDC